MHTVNIEPGMSDHLIVVADIDLKAKVNTKKPWTVFLYKNGNMDGVKEDLKQKFPQFDETHRRLSVEDNWSAFKIILVETMKSHIPQKTLNGRWDIPWMTREIKNRINLKNRLYKKAKHTKKLADWTKFKTVQQQVKDELAQAHEDYVTSLLNINDTDDSKQRVSVTNKFWSYVKSKRRDLSRVSPLLLNDLEVTDSKGKAEILNKQYDSVFTDEDLTNMPTLEQSSIPSLPDIDIHIGEYHQAATEVKPTKGKRT